MKIERFDLEYGWGYPIFLVEIESLDEFPPLYEWPSKHIRVLSIMDSSLMSADDIGAFADRLIDQRCTLFYAAGNDCERVHDIFDMTLVVREIDSKAPFDFCITVWNSDVVEPLEEYMWEFLSVFNPIEAFTETTKTNVVVVNNDNEMADRIRTLFADKDCNWMDGVCKRDTRWRRFIKACRNLLSSSKTSRHAMTSPSASSD